MKKYEVSAEICVDITAESPTEALKFFREKIECLGRHNINDRIRVWLATTGEECEVVFSE